MRPSPCAGYEMPELNALQTVVCLTERPEQTLFTEADKYEIREAEARQARHANHGRT